MSGKPTTLEASQRHERAMARRTRLLACRAVGGEHGAGTPFCRVGKSNQKAPAPQSPHFWTHPNAGAVPTRPRRNMRRRSTRGRALRRCGWKTEFLAAPLRTQNRRGLITRSWSYQYYRIYSWLLL